ncbi:MAG: hypothetical protein RQ751_00520 [Longimicrobiales bacterium]|nr:hypothetical protein [Longimicrobiales bacterium]
MAPAGGGGAYLRWRARLLGAGAALALVGIGLRREWMVDVALGVLIVGFGLRFLPVRGAARRGPAEPDENAGR